MDRQTYEPLVVRRALAGPPELREDLAVALGRAGDPRGLDPLLGLLLDDEPGVRRAAAFASGELAEGFGASRIEERRRAAAGLLEAVADGDRRVGMLAVEGLGKLGVTMAQVAPRMADLEEEERLLRLLPSLHRYPDPETPALARRALEVFAGEESRSVHGLTLAEWAVYALTRDGVLEVGAGSPGAAEPSEVPETVRRLLADPPSPRAAAWLARALGRVGGRAGTGAADLARLRPLLDAESPETVIRALRAARALIASGRAAAPGSWRDRLASLLDAPHAGVRLTAVDAASAWLLDERLGDLLAARARGEASYPVAERGAAVVALATGGDRRAEELAAAAADAPDARLRARAAEAAGILGAETILRALAEDGDSRVRQAVLAVRLAASDPDDRGPPRTAVVRSALGDPDPGVRTVALDWLTTHPVLPVSELAAAVQRSVATGGGGIAPSGTGVPEERLTAVGALAARAADEPPERELAVALLLELASRTGYAVRQRAADALEDLGHDRPAVGTADPGRGVAAYRRILLETREPRAVAVRTERGTFRVRLDCPGAPLTCQNLLRLATQGFYDGLTFHRVVPAFVVQGGDPRGDGWGGPGYTIRDEIGRLRFGPGVVGMALAGPDTGGSQIFVTLAAQPHLDGGYTAFGEVVAGFAVVEQIEPGDAILSIREVGPDEVGAVWPER